MSLVWACGSPTWELGSRGALNQSLHHREAELGSQIDLIYCMEEVWKVENYPRLNKEAQL